MCGEKGKQAFPGGLVYLDLFGGAAVCSLKSRSKERFPGSAIIAAHAAKPFEKIIVCEQDKSLAAACRLRLAKTRVADRCSVLDGDCNDLVHQIVQMIPKKTLTLALVDPKGFDAKFETIAVLRIRAGLTSCSFSRTRMTLFVTSSTSIGQTQIQSSTRFWAPNRGGASNSMPGESRPC